MNLNERDFSFRNVIINFRDESYQEVNFKTHLNRVGKILSDLQIFRLTSFHLTCL